MLQSHADLWLIPLTGVDPQAHGGHWAAVLEEADRVVRARMGEDAGEDDPLYNLVTLLSVATTAVGDPFQLAVSLSHCETFARRALAR